MKPRLIALSGPLKGTSIEIEEEQVTIGRSKPCRVQIPSVTVSDEHCIIRSQAGSFILHDQTGYGGTFVNAVPVSEHPLAHGDQISVGDSLFLFAMEEQDAPGGLSHSEVTDSNLEAQTTVRIQPEDALYLRPDKLQAQLGPDDRIVRHLSALMRISSTVSSMRQPEELQARLLGLILEVIPADRAAILLVGREVGAFESTYVLDRQFGPCPPTQLSRTITGQVLQGQVALLSNDVRNSSSYAQADSIVGSGIRSVLCVPLGSFGRMMGVLYLDVQSPATRFEQDHLELATAIAAIAAVALESARRIVWLEEETRRLQTVINLPGAMIGDSPRMREIARFIERVAPTDATVLIRGETGTGKELAARAIHSRSPRSGKPFVAINCAALTESLLESEMFGHEKGAFTGAIAQKKGKLEAADGGTLFLDEVGELAVSLQAKLLRVLQEREFDRVGGTRPIKVDIRLIAATNRNLEEAVREGRFRQDLYYRLKVVPLVMPPLRDRRADIPLLASYFVAKHGERFNRRFQGLSPEALECLLAYTWPGNVRELENAIEHAVALGLGEEIRPEDLAESLFEAETLGTSTPTRYHEAVKEAKKQVILNALARTGGNFVEGASILEVHPNYLHRLVTNLGLRSFMKQ